MMKPVYRITAEAASPSAGRVVLDPVKAAWNLGMGTCALIFAPMTFGLDVLVLMLATLYLSLLLGHSVGMHRMLIHRSFAAHPLLAHTLVFIGVLVGMAGPFGVIRIHDTRDWAQRQARCHPFFSHDAGLLQDLLWQLGCCFEFAQPPQVNLEPALAQDPYYRHMEDHWRSYQILLAAMLYGIGGWPYVIWGVCVRVFLSNAGHWSITYFCHNPGPGRWRVKDAGVQASNLPGFGLLTFGECWHNNHHAFPESARIGLEVGQFDPGWLVIRLFERLGWVWNVGQPRPETQRQDLLATNPY